MRTFGMALRNIGRNKRRTALALTSVAISIFLVMVLDGLMSGFLGSLVRNYTKNDTGHVNITTSGYRARERFMPVDELIEDSTAVAQAIRSLPELQGRIKAVAERARFGVVLSSGSRSKAALGVAGDPETERSLLMLDHSILPGGRYLERPGDAIVGEKLAKDLGLGVGNQLKVVTQRADSGLGYKRFYIRGIFKTGVNALDGSLFQVGIDDARELLGLGQGCQQILVFLNDYRDADRAAKAIAESLAASGSTKLSAASWTELGDFPRLIKMASSVYNAIYVVVAFLGAFIIANVMMMAVLERRKEIGILKSMGMSRLGVLSLFLVEGSAIGAIGSLLGSGLGLAFNAVFAKVGFDFSAAMAGFDWPMDNVVYTNVDIVSAIAAVILGAAVAAVVSLAPAQNAARLQPIEAIRSV